MKRKAVSVILIVVTSIFLMFSVSCGGGTNREGGSPAGISGSAN